MNGEQPPYPAPSGFVWRKGWFGFGEWELVEDPAYPAPPPGFRYVANFHTSKPELLRTHSAEIHAIEGLSSTGADTNVQSRPNYGPPSRSYVFPTPPDPSKLGRGIESVGPTSNDPPVFVRVNGDPPRLRDKDKAAIFG